MTDKRPAAIALAVGLALVLALLRLLHLGADTPPELSRSAGPYVDEGYKTLDPRNLAQFGTTHWHDVDAYGGWMSSSPITQWPYYAAFRLLGPRVESARLVTILFLLPLLLGFAWTMSGRYPPWLVLSGLALLGLESNLFFFSRIALFELPLASLVFGLLFLFVRLKPQRSIAPLALATIASGILVVGVKRSALFYMVPVLLASSLYLLRESWFRRKLRDWRFLGAALLALTLLLVVGRDQWQAILDAVNYFLDPRVDDVLRRVVENPLAASAPALVLGGLLCAVHGLVCRPDLYLQNIYRLSLVGMVLLGIPLIAIFYYDPLRYYIPLLPAYLLIMLEWIHLKGWRFEPRPTTLPTALLTVAVTALWFHLAIQRLQLPWLDSHKLLLLVAGVLAVGVWIFRAQTLRGRSVAAVLYLMLALFVVQNARALGSFLFAPTYEARTIQHDLSELLPPDSIVAGCWAPFLTLGTDLKTLYVAAGANLTPSLPELAPDYILHTEENLNSKTLLRKIDSMDGLSIGAPVYRSQYNEHAVIVYPLLFNPRSEAWLRRGPFYIGRDLVRAGDPQTAEPWLRRALLERQAEQPPDPLRVAEARSEWSACLLQLGRR